MRKIARFMVENGLSHQQQVPSSMLNLFRSRSYRFAVEQSRRTEAIAFTDPRLCTLGSRRATAHDPTAVFHDSTSIDGQNTTFQISSKGQGITAQHSTEQEYHLGTPQSFSQMGQTSSTKPAASLPSARPDAFETPTKPTKDPSSSGLQKSTHLGQDHLKMETLGTLKAKSNAQHFNHSTSPAQIREVWPLENLADDTPTRSVVRQENETQDPTATNAFVEQEILSVDLVQDSDLSQSPYPAAASNAQADHLPGLSTHSQPFSANLSFQCSGTSTQGRGNPSSPLHMLLGRVRTKIARLNEMDESALKFDLAFSNFRFSIHQEAADVLILFSGLKGISMAIEKDDGSALRHNVRYAAVRLGDVLPKIQNLVRSITRLIRDLEFRWTAQWKALNTFYDSFSSLKAVLAKVDKLAIDDGPKLVEELRWTRAQVLDAIKPESDDELMA